MESFPIHSYQGVGDLEFGISRAAVHELLGPPAYQKRSRFSTEITDCRYDNGLQLVFSSPEGSLVEISLYSNMKNVTFDGIDIFSASSADVYKRLCRSDGDPRIIVGVTVLLRLGPGIDRVSK